MKFICLDFFDCSRSRETAILIFGIGGSGWIDGRQEERMCFDMRLTEKENDKNGKIALATNVGCRGGLE